ncbi:beta-N-acetylhexosaminidase [Xanthobacter tagetidis]|uniref:beta-N-acetylhexosaminidase n=1 Tax=Xanthobacter tagetidis TaxID=60216 RepID=A0A3L6ZYN2_9HYPH|nr:beta-N-acetylhexosaminidase [Xanthobacter tagetidis]MBB6310187.1 beta-N-acetylhexosaminidase [Xanthobacter tagetidis]RLP72848.1 beta-N-acetylhexosaminidase [Xanthobacter tagetidis]
MTVRAFISGCAGTRLSPEERVFFAESAPWGFILFARNVEDPAQVRALVDELRAAVGWNAPVLIDQEGGRVQRLRPPYWPDYPAAEPFGVLHDRDPEAALKAVRLNSRAIAADLAALGIDVDCLPVADLRHPDGHGIIGNRAYGETPAKVAALARAASDGLLDGGVLPVVKHLPGHGRAPADSHERLPVVAAPRAVLESEDFAAFRALADLPLGMTAHVVYRDIDPDRPATTSPVMIADVIRRDIGFSGLLMSDDLSMGALAGSLSDRGRGAIAAGCDLLLHCNGRLEEMREVAAVAPDLSKLAAARAERALALRRKVDAGDVAALRAEVQHLLFREA